jgi:hypothetical protein
MLQRTVTLQKKYKKKCHINENDQPQRTQPTGTDDALLKGGCLTDGVATTSR